jgi:hypothetical protein
MYGENMRNGMLLIFCFSSTQYSVNSFFVTES